MIGRFMQADVYQGDGLNLYAYCANNPVMYYDPSGYARDYPLGFDNLGQFNQAMSELSIALNNSGLEFNSIQVRGSAATGYSDYKTIPGTNAPNPFDYGGKKVILMLP